MMGSVGRYLRRYWYIVAFVALVQVPCMWLLLDRTPPVEWKINQIVPPENKASGTMYVIWDVKANDEYCEGDFYRVLEDEFGRLYFYIPTPVLQVPQGAKQVVAPPFQLPEGLPEGRVVYRPYAVYSCNFMQKLFWPIRYDFPRAEIQIKK